MTMLNTQEMEQQDLAEKCARSACRSCGKTGLLPVLNLGNTPLADRLLKRADEAEGSYPLEVAFCPTCTLVQILETVPPEVLFCNDYPYYSSFSDALLAHSRKNALALIESRRLNSRSLVVELASNDGYLLKNFVEKGIPVLGIDPAEGPARAAEKIGVRTMCSFFGTELAQELRDKQMRADVVIANNVLAHVADTNGFVEGIRLLLKDNGVAVIEAPYVRDLIEHGEFDTIYHQHLCYLSVSSVRALAKRHGLYLNHIEWLPIHGGSLRYYLEPRDQMRASVRLMLEEEAAKGIDRYPYYQSFGDRVVQIRESLRELLLKLKAQGRRIAGYAAAAKACTLLNYAELGTDVIDYVVDRNVHKHGKFMPGVRLPIYDVTKLLEDQPDDVLLLAWNFKDEIIAQQQEYLRRGGRFIVPIPEPKILD
jgi:SAM-dependent methyltransferase